MRTIFVMIKCQLGQAYEVASELVDSIQQVPSVYSTSGDYDLMAQFHLPSDTDIGRFVNEEVHKVSGIIDTKTIICFNAFTPDAGIGES